MKNNKKGIKAMNIQKITLNNIDVFLEYNEKLILTAKGENLFLKIVIIDAPIRGLISAITNSNDEKSIKEINVFVDHVRDLLGLNLDF
jgi:hypothetical protein